MNPKMTVKLSLLSLVFAVSCATGNVKERESVEVVEPTESVEEEPEGWRVLPEPTGFFGVFPRMIPPSDESADSLPCRVNSTSGPSYTLRSDENGRWVAIDMEEAVPIMGQASYAFEYDERGEMRRLIVTNHARDEADVIIELEALDFDENGNPGRRVFGGLMNFETRYE